MLKDGKRMLAYVAVINDIKPLEGYDRVEYAQVGGWQVIVSKSDNFKVGDLCVYFEVDSKVNSKDKRFAFLEKKHYKIKTQKMCKVFSQGLVMPLSVFPEIKNPEVNMDLTDLLKVTYSVEEDNYRKASSKQLKYSSMCARHQKLFKKQPFRWLMRREWGRKIMFFFFGKKKDKPREFPSFIKKTDEDRIENQPWRLEEDKEYLMTEKLDGTSCTYALKRKGRRKFEFFVCSRNVRQKDENQKCYHDTNIYWYLAFKYNIESHLTEYLLTHPECDWVCVQGEGVGSVQGNPLKLEEDDLYLFNFIDSVNGRYSSQEGVLNTYPWGIKWVPILGTTKLPKTMEEMKQLATGKSVVNPSVMREGIVYRSLDGKDSFKNVSREYLLKHNG